MRLIDAVTLKAEFTGNFNGGYYTIPEIKAHIDSAPTVDAAPVVHGRWKAAKAGGPNYPFWDSRCSECGYTTSMVIRNWNYCPKCGAKMDGGDADDH